MTTSRTRKPTAKKVPAAEKAQARSQKAPEPETHQPAAQHTPDQLPGVAIADQAAFMRALGIDPGLAVQNSARIEFNANGVAILTYQAVVPVAPQQLAVAFMASSGLLGGGADDRPEPTDQPGEDDAHSGPVPVPDEEQE